MSSFTAFVGQRRLATGSLATVLTASKAAFGSEAPVGWLVFDDASGRCVELDVRGSLDEALARLPASDTVPAAEPAAESAAKAGRGRPSLGVVAREVTLLPRHWEWLAAQPGGASVALRKLVEAASRTNRRRDAARQAQEACHRFLSTMAGDLPGFEEATRALFANDFDGVRAQFAPWPSDIAAYAERLLYAAQDAAYEARED